MNVIPNAAGAMVLPGVTLFPHALLPLYIFEPRYRKMLADCLSGHRMFAIAHADDDGGVAAIGGLGVVRACVANEDGTSNLILQGVARVVFSEWVMEPYPQAGIRMLEDFESDSLKAAEIRRDVVAACEQIREAGVEAPRGFDEYLAQIREPGAFADAVAAAFVSDPTERRGLLEEPDVTIRLSRLLRCLLRQLQTL